MDGWTFVWIIGKYKKCPQCGCLDGEGKITFDLKDEIVTINCECGFSKKVNRKNEVHI